MKRLMIFALLTSLMANFAFAVETTTECPMMKEMQRRSNPKQNLNFNSKDQKKVNTAKGTGV